MQTPVVSTRRIFDGIFDLLEHVRMELSADPLYDNGLERGIICNLLRAGEDGEPERAFEQRVDDLV